MEVKKGQQTFAQAPKLLYPTFFGFQVDAAQGCGSCGASGENGERSRSHERPRVAWQFIDSFPNEPVSQKKSLKVDLV